MSHEQEKLLSLCRAVMPGVAGVVLSTLGGDVLAHERPRVADPHALAREAAERRHPETQTSALVPRADGLYLVVFVPEPLANEWAPAAAAAPMALGCAPPVS